MKKIFFAILLISIIITGCNSTQLNVAEDSKSKFGEVMGKEWKLAEVWINGINTGFSRAALDRDGFGDIYTLTFDSELLSGAGAPNRYSAPYTLSENHGIKIEIVRATLMAAAREPARLREHDYFVYIQNAEVWNLDGNNLTLTSKNTAGGRVFLIYSR